MSPRRRVEERDLRSLDRPGLRSTFGLLDPNEPPFAERPDATVGWADAGWARFKTLTLGWDEPKWKQALGYLFLPLLLALILLVSWFEIPALLVWLAAVVIFVAAIAWAFWATRKRS